MPITLRGIDFLLTYNCPAQCPHCSYRSGPGRGGRLKPAEVERWLAQIAGHPLEWVLLFGGEPVIYLADLKAMIAAVRRHTRARPQVSTNGYWAHEPGIARDKLAQLQAAGLDCIRFSVDAFHGGFVPAARVALGVQTARALGYRTVGIDVQWVVSPDLDIPTNAATRRMIDALAGMVDLSGVEVTHSRTHPVGRAAERLPEILRAAGEMPAGRCHAEGLCVSPYYLGESLREPYAVEIHPDGTVNLCAGIALGNAHETPLLDALLLGYDYTKHPIIRTVVEGGPGALLAQAEARGYPGLPGYVDPCHLCYEARTYLHAHAPDLRPYLGPPHIYDRDR
ncbi:MAG: radical SAM protein [Anaerolineae bacterium]|nr:radical SAM protein [Anaerolineae bacterium]